MTFLGLYIILLLILLFIFFAWISSAIFGAPFQPSSNKALGIMVRLAEINKYPKGKKIKVADLGSGNGKIVIEYAKLNPKVEAHGFEINPFLAWISRARVKNLGLQGRVFIHRKNFFRQNFKDFDIINSFQINYVMSQMEEKLMKEMKKGAKIISNTWQFPNWKPEKKESYGLGNVYLYVK